MKEKAENDGRKEGGGVREVLSVGRGPPCNIFFIYLLIFFWGGEYT